MKDVSMYTLSTCPWCRKTKKYFTDHNIPFKYVDYDLQPVQEQPAHVRDERRTTTRT